MDEQELRSGLLTILLPIVWFGVALGLAVGAWYAAKTLGLPVWLAGPLACFLGVFGPFVIGSFISRKS